MPRYIDVDALKKLLQNLAHDDWNQITCTTWAEAFEEVADMIDGTPTADAVEVVRCKDCKHRPYTDDDGDVYAHSWDDKTCPCTCEDSYYNWMPEDDFFCKRGERKE